MPLKIWTSADASLLNKTIGTTLKAYRPTVPVHRFIEYVDADDPVVPAMEGEVVIVCGNKTLDILRKAGIVPKNRTVNSLRETPIKSGDGGWYLVTFDPAVTNSEPAKKEVLDWDIRLAVRLMTTGSMLPDIGEYRWVPDFSELIAWIEAEYEKTGKPVRVAGDTETMGLHPWYPDRDIVSIAFTAKPSTADVLYLGDQPCPVPADPNSPLWDQINWLLTSPKVKTRFANGKYDLVWIKVKWGIVCTNFVFDTMIVGSLLDENRSNSLNLHAKLFTTIGGYDDPMNAKWDKGHMELLPADDEFLTYAGGDTDACQQSADVLLDQLAEEPGLMNFYKTIAHPAVRAFERVEERGIVINVEKYAKLGEELDKTIQEQTDLAMDLLPNKIRLKYMEKIQDQISDGKSPLTPALLKDYFFTPMGLNLKPKMVTPKTEAPSMAKSHLRMFADVPEAVQMVSILTEMDSAAKTNSTFVRGFLKHLRPDGRFHPSYMLFHGGFNDSEEEDDESGSVSGRLSAKEPAFQTLPAKTKYAKRLRECYEAPEGKVILAFDYSQGELKVVACIAPEETMIASYKQGLDLHAVTGAQLASTPLEVFLTWKDNEDKALADLFDYNRAKAKPANFGLLYGMGAAGFQAYAWANYGLKLTLAEAEEMRDAFFILYPGLPDYHEDMIKLANKMEQVVSPLGRIRHLQHIRAWDRAIRAKAERQAINSPVQSTLTDMMIWAIALIEADVEKGALPSLEIFGMIHDAFYAYVDIDKVEQTAAHVRQIMENLPFEESFGWKPQLKFTADGEFGPNLANKTKIKLKAA